jgi:hypothetical protein
MRLRPIKRHKEIVKLETPVFTKQKSRSYDYQEMTWGKFIKLREWAKSVVDNVGYPIYLVGSTLYKEVPRDFDIVIIIPQKEHEEKFGEMNNSNFGWVLATAFQFYVKEYFDCEEMLGECGHTPLDFKIYPDNWFVENDKLLLAEPKR